MIMCQFLLSSGGVVHGGYSMTPLPVVATPTDSPEFDTYIMERDVKIGM
jgi:hypothetical protein